jgi:hypothetical protein
MPNALKVASLIEPGCPANSATAFRIKQNNAAKPVAFPSQNFSTAVNATDAITVAKHPSNSHLG